MKACRYLVSGKVQGVFYRVFTRNTASSLKLTGWVRNLPDGRVEVFAQGEEDTVDKLRGVLERGPDKAVVTGIEQVPEEYSGKFTTFEIIR